MLCLPMCVCCIQEEDEVPDDETVNQMIARSEEEFDQFMVSVLKINLELIQVLICISNSTESSPYTCLSLPFFLVWPSSAYGPRPASRGGA